MDKTVHSIQFCKQCDISVYFQICFVCLLFLYKELFSMLSISPFKSFFKLLVQYTISNVYSIRLYVVSDFF